MGPKIAVVTGSNKGIGYAIVRGLAKKFDGLVYLTARDQGRGKESVKQVQSEVGDANKDKIRFHQLDLTKQSSIDAFRDYIKKEHGQIDVLVNNAGIAYKGSDPAPFKEQATVTNQTNYFGTQAVCHTLYPLLAPHARVVVVASRVGTMILGKCSDEMKEKFKDQKLSESDLDSMIKKFIEVVVVASRAGTMFALAKLSPSLQAKFQDPNLTESGLDGLIKEFIDLAQTGKHQEAGYANSAYGMSKLGNLVMASIHQGQFDKDSREDIVINAACPGYVDTDMTSHGGKLTIDQGADTMIYLATLPPSDANNPKGQFLAERKVINWRAGEGQNIA